MLSRAWSRVWRLLKNWRRDWLWIDLLALLLGASAILSYILFAGGLQCVSDETKAVWSNLGTEILGIWISVRIIDGLIKAQDERPSARGGVANALVHMMQTCQDLPPGYRQGTIDDIQNALDEFERNSKAVRGSEQLRSYFIDEERTSIDAFLKTIAEVRALAQQVQPTVFEFRELCDQRWRWTLTNNNVREAVQELIDATSRYLYGDADGMRVGSQIDNVRRILRQGLGSDEIHRSQVSRAADITGDVLDRILIIQGNTTAARKDVQSLVGGLLRA
jgi:hypothetical protein